MSYAKGRRLEYRSMAYLERDGYQCIRSAGIHGPVDIVAVNDAGGLFVQVKANRLPSPDERQTLAAFATLRSSASLRSTSPCPPGWKRVIHRWRDFSKAPEVFDA